MSAHVAVLPALYLLTPRGRVWGLCQRGIAAGALVALAPLFALMWLATRLSSRGPFLFRQQRRGLGGVPFAVYKVRTLRQGSEQGTALGIQQGDARVTRVGRILRELKLDELPQLWNVVRGEMELVGPRPIPMALEDELRTQITGFQRRHALRPGLTNLAQVSIFDNQLGDDLRKDWRCRFEGELHCVRHKSASYDLIVIGLTVLFLVRKVLSRLGRLRTQPAGAVQ